MKRRNKIIYSQKWYDEEYNEKIYNADKLDYQKLMKFLENSGYKKRLYDVLDKVNIKPNSKWLEVACHHGKTVFWTAERYPNLNINFFMFDFSTTSIEWIKRNNPIPEKTVVWRGDIQEIAIKGNLFEDFFDIITCIDVTEHLPVKIYKKGIKEMYRVLKPGGQLIIMQGISDIIEHINIRPEKEYVNDFKIAGFKLIKNLPYRHSLLTK
ncbi:unnamed protein product [marine sediment metagenome]|uniref:Methyltransferase domain-containing protein n=1 Tax=marine sediment metagenome TaxID=412755 RepID=X1JTG1_9ZZZZ